MSDPYTPPLEAADFPVLYGLLNSLRDDPKKAKQFYALLKLMNHVGDQEQQATASLSSLRLQLHASTDGRRVVEITDDAPDSVTALQTVLRQARAVANDPPPPPAAAEPDLLAFGTHNWEPELVSSVQVESTAYTTPIAQPRREEAPTRNVLEIKEIPGCGVGFSLGLDPTRPQQLALVKVILDAFYGIYPSTTSNTTA